MKIEFGSLQIGELAKNHIQDCINNNWITSGKKVQLFEEHWGQLFDYKYNLAVSSGTDACLNACLTLYDFGAQRGDEIIVPALSFIATANAVLAAGFIPVFVDINIFTLNINAFKIEEKITSKTRAIFCVHTMGKPCDLDTIKEIAKKYQLFVFEDGCEAHGAKYKDNYIGTQTDLACFSFYSAHLICTAEGGMVSTQREDLANIIKSTRTHGRKDGQLYFDHVRFGLNSKMNDLEASIGLETIATFWDTYHKRKHNLNYLIAGLRDLQHLCYFNKEEKTDNNCPHALSILLMSEKYPLAQFIAYLEANEIHAKRTFGCIPTQHQAFAWMNYAPGSFPEAEYVGNHGVHLGCHQYLTQENLDYMIEVIHEYFKNE